MQFCDYWCYRRVNIEKLSNETDQKKMTEELLRCLVQSLGRDSCFPLQDSGKAAKAALSHQLLAAGGSRGGGKASSPQEILDFAQPGVSCVSIFFSFLHKSRIGRGALAKSLMALCSCSNNLQLLPCDLKPPAGKKAICSEG